MPVTTIKVSTHTRDLLKRQAARVDLSLGDHVARLAEAAERGLRFEALRDAIAATPPDARDAYERERAAWLDADLD
ncbi:hypothetical protein [Nocardioides sp.]|uniref:hypothetical protein n=1 Tax=Nocardioides sp. TaxID=35761 RepID=UPI003510D7BD